MCEEGFVGDSAYMDTRWLEREIVRAPHRVASAENKFGFSENPLTGKPTPVGYAVTRDTYQQEFSWRGQDFRLEFDHGGEWELSLLLVGATIVLADGMIHVHAGVIKHFVLPIAHTRVVGINALISIVEEELAEEIQSRDKPS